jgi:hypothetical protein
MQCIALMQQVQLPVLLQGSRFVVKCSDVGTW